MGLLVETFVDIAKLAAADLVLKHVVVDYFGHGLKGGINWY